MKQYNWFFLFGLWFGLLQGQIPEDFGFRHLQYEFEGDTVDVLVKSKKGEENIKKPIFFSVQGSLAVPLIIHNGKQRTTYATLEEGFVENQYHLVIVNKPGVPLVAHEDSLVGKEYFSDPDNFRYTEKYLKNNNKEYYVARNLMILLKLYKQSWVDTTKLVVAGHSQGSSIAATMCDMSSKPTHLIYSSGLPYFSTMLAIVSKERINEGLEKNPRVERAFASWQEVLDNPLNHFDSHRDSNKTLYSFSKNENEILKRLRIPVLISYGTSDESSPYQDMFRLEAIRDRASHISFKPYVGLDHNYQFKMNLDSNKSKKVDYLERVLKDWLDWISIH